MADCDSVGLLPILIPAACAQVAPLLRAFMPAMPEAAPPANMPTPDAPREAAAIAALAAVSVASPGVMIAPPVACPKAINSRLKAFQMALMPDHSRMPIRT